ncbi:hypothetical protein HC891_01770 [Candidatus Gracilibacteria bacterium]|nr:hypothetical protein [Candidatus Gracilibacteria bacterium]
MRAVRLALAILVAVLVAGAVPARADSNNVIVVDGGFFFDPKPINNLLPGEEVQRIEQLITGTRITSVYSQISPDDSTVIVGDDERFGFLNVQNGSFRPLDFNIFLDSLLIPAPLLDTTYRFGWRDDRTLASLALDFNAETIEQAFGIVLIDVVTGEVSFRALTLPTNNFAVLGQSPDGSKAMFLLAPPVEDFFKPNRQPLLAHIPVTYHGPDVQHETLALPTKLQRSIAGLNGKRPHLAASLYASDREALQVATIEIDLTVIDMVSGNTRELTTLNETSIILNYPRWSVDSAKVAVPLSQIWDADTLPRARFDGALISDALYRDVSGNLAPQDNPFYQNNELLVYDIGKGTGQSLKATASDGVYFYDSSFSTDGQTLMVEALVPGKLKGARTQSMCHSLHRRRAGVSTTLTCSR